MEEASDLNTHLPPRKRLLAGMRTGSPSSDPEFPSPLASGDIAARLREVMNSADLSPEEILEIAKLAEDAAAVAAAAKEEAATKAAAAVKARAKARSALEYLDSLSRCGGRRNVHRAKGKSKAKHVPVKVFYKNGRKVESDEDVGEDEADEMKDDEVLKPLRSNETDEEIARKLHVAMNSSPRKKPRRSVKARVIADSVGDAELDGMAPVLNDDEVGDLNKESSQDKSDGQVISCPRSVVPEENSSNSTGNGKSSFLSDAGSITRRSKIKVKRKKMVSNDAKAFEEHKEAINSTDSGANLESTSDGIKKGV